MTDQPSLLPCPFCGGEAEAKSDHTVEQSHFVFCKSCRLTIVDDDAPWSCLAYWNTRAAIAPVVKELQWVDDNTYGLGQWGNGIFNYQIRLDPGRDHWRWRRVGSDTWYYGEEGQPPLTKERAKDAAQADYERRILSALATPPQAATSKLLALLDEAHTVVIGWGATTECKREAVSMHDLSDRIETAIAQIKGKTV